MLLACLFLLHPGTYAADDLATKCVAAPAGSAVAGNRSTAFAECEPGTVSPASSNRSLSCRVVERIDSLRDHVLCDRSFFCSLPRCLDRPSARTAPRAGERKHLPARQQQTSPSLVSPLSRTATRRPRARSSARACRRDSSSRATAGEDQRGEALKKSIDLRDYYCAARSSRARLAALCRWAAPAASSAPPASSLRPLVRRCSRFLVLRRF